MTIYYQIWREIREILDSPSKKMFFDEKETLTNCLKSSIIYNDFQSEKEIRERLDRL